MNTTLTPDIAADAARGLLDARVDVVRRLANVGEQRTAAHQAAALADAEYSNVWREATTKAGWSERELTTIGFEKPGGAPRRKARKALLGAPGTADAAPAPHASEPDAHGAE